MKDKVLKNIGLACIIALTVGCVSCTNAQKRDFQSRAKDLASAHEWVSFELVTEMQKDDSTLWISHENVVLHYDGKNPVIFSEWMGEDGGSRSEWMDKDKFIKVDHASQEIARYDNKKVFWDDYHSYGTTEFIPHIFHYLSYYLFPMRKQMGNGMMVFLVKEVKSQESVVVKGNSYTRFHGTSSTASAYDPKTGKRVPVYNEVDWFVNDATGILDSVFSVQYPLDFENRKEYISLRNIDFSDKRNYIETVFDLDSPRYDKYSRHNSDNPPLSKAYSSNKSMTDDLLNYPLRKLDGSETTIAQTNGWLLLNFWSINCQPCVAHLKEMGQEKDSLGNYYLETQGVKVLAINHRSNNVELIRSIAEKTNTFEIVYYANGMGGVIDIPMLGYYYLVSPDKQIVYETYNLGDYSELLEGKANYEKQKGK
jgi:hypothetical protein